MSHQEDEIELSDVPVEELRDVLSVLFQHLSLRLSREKTPDYTAYYIDDK